MAGLGLILSLLLVPNIQQRDKSPEDSSDAEDSTDEKTQKQPIFKHCPDVLAKFNPMKIFRPLKYPNVLFAVSFSSLLSFSSDE
jgi:hypothetical protein